jgi:copper resistance protein C
VKRAALAFAMMALLFGGASTVRAHAFMERAVPAVGSVVHGSPREVSLRFNEELEPAFSTLRVLDRSGKQVDKGDKEVSRTDRTLLKVSLQPLAQGTYRVVWRALSVDGHATEGDYTFEVLP